MQPNASLYQVNVSVEDVGKRRPKTKKLVTWTFSVDDQRHTVALVWSKRTGKQRVDMDGAEVWFGRKQGASVCFHKWTSREGLNLHILACKATPKKKYGADGFRKYELIINSQSFTSLPFQDRNMPPPTGVDGTARFSILDICYPEGYQWNDTRFGMASKHVSTLDESQELTKLRRAVTARRIVKHDGTAR